MSTRAFRQRAAACRRLPQRRRERRGRGEVGRIKNAKICILVLAFNLMEITKLSPQGQVIIPESLREAHQWEVGQEFIIIDMGDGILLKPKKPFAVTKLDHVAGCLKYPGKPITLEDMDNAIRQGVEES